jgi:hypothetical protein
MAVLAPRSKVGIIVTGMHRSGTSATTRLINLLGADIARDLMPACEENSRGFWESMAVLQIHDGLLHRLGSSWDDPMPLPDGWIDTEGARQARSDLAQVLTSQFSGSKIFVAKDPRASRLLPLWLDLFAELAVTPVVVIGFRNPLEVALSLRARNQFALAKSLLIYARSHLEVERASRHEQRIFVHYEQMLADWRPFSQKLRQIVGPLLPPASPESTAEIGNFLDRDMQHYRCTYEELAGTPTIASPIVEMYRRMCEASGTGNESPLCESFDRLERIVTDATTLFQGVVAAGEESRRELADQVMAHESRTATLSEALAAESTEMARVKAELEAARCQGVALAAALEVRSAEATELATVLMAEQGRTAALQQALAAEAIAMARVKSELEVEGFRAAELAASLEVRSADAAALTASLEALAMEAAELRAEVTAWRDRTTRSESEIAARIAELHDIRQSTSWRVTRPVRWVGRGIARARYGHVVVETLDG